MALTLRRPARRRSIISVVSMIDVMMILLFFFMITSSYLNLDMVPALQKSDALPDAPQASGAVAATLMVRIDGAGQAQVAGKVLPPADLTSLIAARVAADPATPVVIFPSGGADLQALITVMDAVTKAGAKSVKVIRIEASP